MDVEGAGRWAGSMVAEEGKTRATDFSIAAIMARSAAEPRSPAARSPSRTGLSRQSSPASLSSPASSCRSPAPEEDVEVDVEQCSDGERDSPDHAAPSPAPSSELGERDTPSPARLLPPATSCNCEELLSVDCQLETKELWDKFHDLGTEMIITKTGSFSLQARRVRSNREFGDRMNTMGFNESEARVCAGPQRMWRRNEGMNCGVQWTYSHALSRFLPPAAATVVSGSPCETSLRKTKAVEGGVVCLDRLGLDRTSRVSTAQCARNEVGRAGAVGRGDGGLCPNELLCHPRPLTPAAARSDLALYPETLLAISCYM
ncbi:unnamed protein product, partial [Iphiclides podalirius]